MTEHLNDLKEIRSMMEKSSRFLSLSGASGIAMGTVALLAAGVAYYKKLAVFTELESPTASLETISRYVSNLIGLALVTLVLAISLGIYFTYRKAKNSSGSLWNAVSRKLFMHLSIPLVIGGFVVIALLINKVYWLIPESMLLFYGLALINASHYTYRDVFYLGLCQLALGVIALFVNGYSLLFWALGFGVLHIVYGLSMHFKYDKAKN